MIKPVNKNVLLKRENISNSLIIMPNEYDDFFVCIAQGDNVCLNFINKRVFVKEGLIKIEYEGSEYFLCDEKNILAVEE